MPFLLFWQFSPTTQSESKGNKSKFQTWGSRSILIPLTQSLLSLTIRSWCNVFIDPLNIALLCFTKEKKKSLLWEITISIDPDKACSLFPNVCQKNWSSLAHNIVVNTWNLPVISFYITCFVIKTKGLFYNNALYKCTAIRSSWPQYDIANTRSVLVQQFTQFLFWD